MLRRGDVFQFEVPDDWVEERDSSRFIFRGPMGEELIVSGTVIQGVGPDEERKRIRAQLFQDAALAVEKAASHPELAVLRPLSRDEAITAVECWTLHAETRARDFLFSEAIALDDFGLALITFEAPNRAECLAEYGRLLKSIRPVKPC